MIGVRFLRSLFHETRQWYLVALVILAGCEQRDLCYDHSHVSPVTIEFDWSHAPDAEPQTMVVWFFSANSSGESYRFELSGNGASVRSKFDSHISVRPGTYHVLCHNGTTDNNSEKGGTFDDYWLVTYTDAILSPMNRTDGAPLPDDAAHQPVRAQASTLYAHTLDRFVTIEPSATAEKRIKFIPEEVTSVYDVIITGVENLRADTEASAVITGLAEAWHPGSSCPAGTEVVVPFHLEHCGSSCLRGSLVVFGDNAPHDVKHYLRVYTSYKYYYDFDVTDEIHNAGNSKHIEIKLNGIKLPVSQEGGLSPGVEGWESAENIDIQM